MKFPLDEVGRATGGRLIGTGEPYLELDGVSTDSRAVRPGSLFVALRGPRFDGHDYVAKALGDGARAVLVEQGRAPAGAPAIEVDDTLVSLGRLAQWVRRRRGLTVVAITGSVGKTTTKELTAEVLRASGGNVLQTPGNWNNRIGLPLTLLGARGDEDTAVLELGISEPGEMAHLTAICEPDVAVVTAVAHAHTELLGGLEGVAREKLTIVEGLRPGGTLVLPHGDPLLRAPQGVRTVTFGWHEGANLRGDQLKLQGRRGCRFQVDGLWFDLSLHGRHNAHNALAALAVARLLGVFPADAARGLAALEPSPLRGELKTSDRGFHLLLDCYNANPTATEAALETLENLSGESRRIAVLGEMKELGGHSRESHARIGRAAAERGVSSLHLLGADTRWTREAALEAGLEPSRVHWHEDRETLAEALNAELGPGDWVLVKGSRAVGLETVADRLCAASTSDPRARRD